MVDQKPSVLLAKWRLSPANSASAGLFCFERLILLTRYAVTILDTVTALLFGRPKIRLQARFTKVLKPVFRCPIPPKLCLGLLFVALLAALHRKLV